MEKLVALKASAGSGKTFSLVVRYLSLLFLKAKPNEILALTFTNKAANEMRERIYSTLLNLENEPNYIKNIAMQTNLSEDDIKKNKSIILKEFLSSEIKIYTIDKFIHQIIRSFSFEASISKDFTVSSQKSDILNFAFLKELNEVELDDFIFFELFENKKFSSMLDSFEILEEKIGEMNILDYKVDIDFDLNKRVLKNALIIKDAILNSNLSNSANNSVDFYDIDSLFDKGKTWLTKDRLQ
ncbi:MAG: UvrD-helicase domain-containing protein, partial [Campylobacterales bacterium]|nr:UvrD-helicase domain-containing protein [Campylobacterales bacterium]